MAEQFDVPEPWASRGWRIKIRDRERNEEPHVSVFFKTSVWRFGLRTRDFLDRNPDPGSVPAGLVEHLRNSLREYIAAWDRLHPENSVTSEEGQSGDEDVET